jgi:hypothetical protein
MGEFFYNSDLDTVGVPIGQTFGNHRSKYLKLFIVFFLNGLLFFFGIKVSSSCNST